MAAFDARRSFGAPPRQRWLVQTGRISAGEWAASLGSAIKQAQDAGDRDDGSTYYHHVLDALEALACEKALATPDALAARKEAWRAAYAGTPHGEPVLAFWGRFTK